MVRKRLRIGGAVRGRREHVLATLRKQRVQNLLVIVFLEWQHGRNVEHGLAVPPLGEYRVETRGVPCSNTSCTVSFREYADG